jgi:hypothetical protein
MQFVEPVPKPNYPKKKMERGIPQYVMDEVDRRSGNLCEAPDCPNRQGDYRGMTYAHRFQEGPKNKGMGGTRRVPTAKDIWRACFPCHNRLDHHIRKG